MNLPAAISSSSIKTKCSLPLRISSMTSGFITDPPMTVTRAIDVDERCDSKLGVDVAGRAKAGGDGYDGAAVD